jgi:cellobiose-specific phosphotransferase system component IIB
VKTDSFDVAWNGEMIRIDVEANVDYTVVMPQVEWMYEETSLNDGTGHHYILVTPNESYEPRSAEIVVRNEDKELADTVYVAQKAQEKPEAFLRVQNKHFNVAWTGEIIRFDIETNVDYTLVAPDVEWLYEAPEYGGGVGTGYHYFMVTPNEGYEPRKAEIVVKNEAEGLADTVYVTQAAREKPEPYLTISIEQYRAPKEGDSMLVDVYTNTEYNLEMPEVDWLTESEHSSPEQRLFVIAPNKGYDERSAEVVFANEQYGLRSTLIVTQGAKDLLELISADKIELEASARSFELKIRANGEPEVTSNVDWLSLKSQSQGDNYERTYVFDVDAEQAGVQRYAMIQICHKSMYLYVQVELKSVEGNGGIDDMPEHPL